MLDLKPTNRKNLSRQYFCNFFSWIVSANVFADQADPMGLLDNSRGTALKIAVRETPSQKMSVGRTWTVD